MRIAAVRRPVSAWPGVSEDVKWSGGLVFSVGGKMFCAMRVAAAGGLAFPRVGAGRFLEYPGDQEQPAG